MFNGFNQPPYETDPGRDSALKKPSHGTPWPYGQSFYNPEPQQQTAPAPAWQPKPTYSHMAPMPGKCACAQCQQSSWYPKEPEPMLSSSTSQDVMMLGSHSGVGGGEYPVDIYARREESYLRSSQQVAKPYQPCAYPTPTSQGYAPRITAIKQPANPEFSNSERSSEQYMRMLEQAGYGRKVPEQRPKYWEGVNGAFYPTQQYPYPPSSCRYPQYNPNSYYYQGSSSVQSYQHPQHPQHQNSAQQYYGVVPNPMRQMDVRPQPAPAPAYLKQDNNASTISPLRLMRKKKHTESVEQPSPPRLTAPPDNAPTLDVRRFLATWADEDEESSPAPQMVVLDCQDINADEAELLRMYEESAIRIVPEPVVEAASEVRPEILLPKLIEAEKEAEVEPVPVVQDPVPVLTPPEKEAPPSVITNALDCLQPPPDDSISVKEADPVEEPNSSPTPSPVSPANSHDSLPALADLPTSEYRKNKFLDYDQQSFPQLTVRSSASEANVVVPTRPESAPDLSDLRSKIGGKKRNRKPTIKFSIQKSHDLKISLRVMNESKSPVEEEEEVTDQVVTGSEETDSRMITLRLEDNQDDGKRARKSKRRRLLEQTYSVSSEEHCSVSTDGFQVQESVDSAKIKLTFKRRRGDADISDQTQPRDERYRKKKKGKRLKTGLGNDTVGAESSDCDPTSPEEPPAADTTTDYNGLPPSASIGGADNSVNVLGCPLSPLLLGDGDVQDPLRLDNAESNLNLALQPEVADAVEAHLPRRWLPPETWERPSALVQPKTNEPDSSQQSVYAIKTPRRSNTSSPKITSSGHITSPRTSTDSIERELQAIWNGDVQDSTKKINQTEEEGQRTSEGNVVDFYTEDIPTEPLLEDAGQGREQSAPKPVVSPVRAASADAAQVDLEASSFDRKYSPPVVEFEEKPRKEPQRAGVICHGLNFLEDEDLTRDQPLDLRGPFHCHSSDTSKSSAVPATEGHVAPISVTESLQEAPQNQEAPPLKEEKDNEEVVPATSSDDVDSSALMNQCNPDHAVASSAREPFYTINEGSISPERDFERESQCDAENNTDPPARLTANSCALLEEHPVGESVLKSQVLLDNQENLEEKLVEGSLCETVNAPISSASVQAPDPDPNKPDVEKLKEETDFETRPDHRERGENSEELDFSHKPLDYVVPRHEKSSDEIEVPREEALKLVSDESDSGSDTESTGSDDSLTSREPFESGPQDYSTSNGQRSSQEEVDIAPENTQSNLGKEFKKERRGPRTPEGSLKEDSNHHEQLCLAESMRKDDSCSDASFSSDDEESALNVSPSAQQDQTSSYSSSSSCSSSSSSSSDSSTSPDARKSPEPRYLAKGPRTPDDDVLKKSPRMEVETDGINNFSFRGLRTPEDTNDSFSCSPRSIENVEREERGTVKGPRTPEEADVNTRLSDSSSSDRGEEVNKSPECYSRGSPTTNIRSAVQHRIESTELLSLRSHDVALEEKTPTKQSMNDEASNKTSLDNHRPVEEQEINIGTSSHLSEHKEIKENEDNLDGAALVELSNAACGVPKTESIDVRCLSPIRSPKLSGETTFSLVEATSCKVESDHENEAASSNIADEKMSGHEVSPKPEEADTVDNDSMMSLVLESDENANIIVSDQAFVLEDMITYEVDAPVPVDPENVEDSPEDVKSSFADEPAELVVWDSVPAVEEMLDNILVVEEMGSEQVDEEEPDTDTVQIEEVEFFEALEGENSLEDGEIVDDEYIVVEEDSDSSVIIEEAVMVELTSDEVLCEPVLDVNVAEIPLPPGEAPKENCFDLEHWKRCRVQVEIVNSAQVELNPCDSPFTAEVLDLFRNPSPPGTPRLVMSPARQTDTELQASLDATVQDAASMAAPEQTDDLTSAVTSDVDGVAMPDDAEFHDVMENCLANAKKFLSRDSGTIDEVAASSLTEVLEELVKGEDEQVSSRRDVLLSSFEAPSDLEMGGGVSSADVSMGFSPFHTALGPESLPVDNWPYLEEEVPLSPEREETKGEARMDPNIDLIHPLLPRFLCTDRSREELLRFYGGNPGLMKHRRHTFDSFNDNIVPRKKFNSERQRTDSDAEMDTMKENVGNKLKCRLSLDRLADDGLRDKSCWWPRNNANIKESEEVSPRLKAVTSKDSSKTEETNLSEEYKCSKWQPKVLLSRMPETEGYCNLGITCKSEILDPRVNNKSIESTIDVDVNEKDCVSKVCPKVDCSKEKKISTKKTPRRDLSSSHSKIKPKQSETTANTCSTSTGCEVPKPPSSLACEIEASINQNSAPSVNTSETKLQKHRSGDELAEESQTLIPHSVDHVKKCVGKEKRDSSKEGVQKAECKQKHSAKKSSPSDKTEGCEAKADNELNSDEHVNSHRKCADAREKLLSKDTSGSEIAVSHLDKTKDSSSSKNRRKSQNEHVDLTSQKPKTSHAESSPKRRMSSDATHRSRKMSVSKEAGTGATHESQTKPSNISKIAANETSANTRGHSTLKATEHLLSPKKSSNSTHEFAVALSRRGSSGKDATRSRRSSHGTDSTPGECLSPSPKPRNDVQKSKRNSSKASTPTLCKSTSVTESVPESTLPIVASSERVENHPQVIPCTKTTHSHKPSQTPEAGISTLPTSRLERSSKNRSSLGEPVAASSESPNKVGLKSPRTAGSSAKSCSGSGKTREASPASRLSNTPSKERDDKSHARDRSGEVKASPKAKRSHAADKVNETSQPPCKRLETGAQKTITPVHLVSSPKRRIAHGSNDKRKASASSSKTHEPARSSTSLELLVPEESEKRVPEASEKSGATDNSAMEDESSDTEQPWVCKVCGFSDVEKQQKHIQEHSFHCQSCHLAFRSEAHFIRHLTRRHQDIRKMHHCLLCELSFETDGHYQEHLLTREHRHIEAVEKSTIQTLFSLLSGQACPVLGDAPPRSDWLPSQAGTVHFYHQATPLSLAMQYWKVKESAAASKQ